jgi:hypothetical protein
MATRNKEYRDSVQRHVLWEMDVFLAATDLRLDHTQWRHHKYLYSIYTDSLLIHARNLYHFFSGNKTRKGDIVAADLVTDADGTPWKTSGLSFLRSCVDDISKFRGHLTSIRNERDRRWSDSVVRRIRSEIEAAWLEFVMLIPESERKQWKTLRS